MGGPRAPATVGRPRGSTRAAAPRRAGARALAARPPSAASSIEESREGAILRLWSGEVWREVAQEGGVGSGCEISSVRRPLPLLPLRCRPRGAKSGARASRDWGAVGGGYRGAGAAAWGLAERREVLALAGGASLRRGTATNRRPPPRRAKEGTGGPEALAGGVDRCGTAGGAEPSQTNQGVTRNWPFWRPPGPTGCWDVVGALFCTAAQRLLPVPSLVSAGAQFGPSPQRCPTL